MFENLSHLALQQYWWVIIAALAGALVFLLFVQGGQTLIYQLGKDETQRSLIVNTLGRKWEFTFTTLVTFGGAFFASFPLFYSTSFGGAYWVWIVILFAFVIQAVSYEYRKKPSNFLGARTYETFLFINGLVGTVFIGTAVGTFFTGSAFHVNMTNITNLGGEQPLAISYWANSFHGLEAIWNTSELALIQNLSLGLAVFFLSRILGILYFMNTIEHQEILSRSRKALISNAIPFLLAFLVFAIRLLLIDGWGYTYDAASNTTTIVHPVENKYLHNLLEMPLVLILFLAGVVGVLWGIGKSAFKTWSKGIWFAGIGTFLVVFSLFLVAGFNNTAYYPSSVDVQSSLTITNSSSSKFTLTVMSYVSLLVPFVFAYIFYTWRSINRKKITAEELQEDSTHVY